MQFQNKRPHTVRVLGNAERPRVTKLSPEAMIGPPLRATDPFGPLFYELGCWSFKPADRVRIPGGLPGFLGEDQIVAGQARSAIPLPSTDSVREEELCVVEELI